MNFRTSAAASSIATKLGFAVPAKTPRAVVYAVAGPPPKHPKMRLAAHPGKPRLRVGRAYRKTGFRRPVKTSVLMSSALPLRVLRSATTLPENFAYAPHELTTTIDQGNCGSCWACSAAHSIGDRVVVQTANKVRTSVSIQQIMECSEYMEEAKPIGCDGNDIFTCFKSLATNKKKLVAKGEYAKSYDETPSTASNCKNADDSKYHVVLTEAYNLCKPVMVPGDANNQENIRNMKTTIYNEGPIVAGFMVYSDFFDYDASTIYEPLPEMYENPNASQGGHAIEIFGWGKDPASNTEYWVCRNSWGVEWPANRKPCAGSGVFYFKMGSNICGIEEYCATGKVAVYNPESAPRDIGNVHPLDTDCKVQDTIPDSSTTEGNTTAPMSLSSFNKPIVWTALGVGAGGILVYMLLKNKK